jgi:hypothetical protein
MPHWATQGAEYGITKPYAFWNVADQPMLYHWFDLAHESDYEKVIFHSPDADQLKTLYFDRESFWPVKCQFTDNKPPAKKSGQDYSVVSVDSLHQTGIPLKTPDLWGMIDNHWKLVSDRLEILWLKHQQLAPGLAVGRHSTVHPSANLIAPYWIGNGCEIGENCTVGPFACIGDFTRLERGACLSSTHAGQGLVIGEDIVLNSHFAEEGKLFNRKKRIRHKSTDPLILEFAQEHAPNRARSGAT